MSIKPVIDKNEQTRMFLLRAKVTDKDLHTCRNVRFLTFAKTVYGRFL